MNRVQEKPFPQNIFLSCAGMTKLCGITLLHKKTPRKNSLSWGLCLTPLSNVLEEDVQTQSPATQQ